jgi:thioredoxin 1
MENFKEVVLDSSEKVMVKFGASWCGPCRVMDGRLQQLIYDNLNVEKVDVEKFPKIGAKYAIRNLPTIIVFQNGEVAERFEGYASVDQLREKLK